MAIHQRFVPESIAIPTGEEKLIMFIEHTEVIKYLKTIKQTPVTLRLGNIALASIYRMLRAE